MHPKLAPVMSATHGGQYFKGQKALTIVSFAFGIVGALLLITLTVKQHKQANLEMELLKKKQQSI